RPASSFRPQARPREAGEGAGAMRQALALAVPAMLLLGAHLAEATLISVRQEHRIVAEAIVAARRPYQPALDLAAIFLRAAIGKGEAEDGDEARLAPLRRNRAGLLQSVLDEAHGGSKILAGARPARRIDARIAIERIDGEAGIVGERRQAGGERRGERLDARI